MIQLKSDLIFISDNPMNIGKPVQIIVLVCVVASLIWYMYTLLLILESNICIGVGFAFTFTPLQIYSD